MAGGRLAAVVAWVLLAAAGAVAQSPAQPAPRATPLSLQGVLLGVRKSITNWPAFAKANNLSGWDPTSTLPPCLWTGATCDGDGKLTGIALQCFGCPLKAEGTLPLSITQSDTLQTFNLQQNALGGPLPKEWASPGVLPSLLNMVVLGNKLTGSIPEEWAHPQAFPKVTLLAIGNNRLTGTIPTELALPSLLILRANGNNFSGLLPPTWGTNGSMPNVRVLALHQNQLTGPLPPEWGAAGQLESLEEIYLQDNQLTGELPPEWAGSDSEGFPLLRILNLSNNPLGPSTLPFQWSAQHSFASLRTLALSNTGLQGTLPPSWDCKNRSRCGLINLETLWLDGNNVSGPIPHSWSLLPALQSLFVRPGNELLCMPPAANFSFRLCDAHGSIDCSQTAQLPPCPAEGAAAGPAAAPDGQQAAGAPGSSGGEGAGGTSGGGGGGSSAGAIAGGVVGGVAGAAAALGLLLVWRRRRRKRRRTEREAPFYAAEEGGDKSSNQPSSSRPFEPPDSLGPGSDPAAPAASRLSHDDVAFGLMLSPFSAAADADLEASIVGAGANGGLASAPRPPQQAQQAQHAGSTASSDSFFRAMLGYAAGHARPPEGIEAGGGGGAVELAEHAGRAAADADRALDAELDRHLSLELLAMESALSTQHTANSAGTAGTARTSGTGGTAPSPTHALPPEAAAGGLWEDSVGLSDWQITPAEIQIAKRPDGSDWELGTGGFGKVYKALRHGAQPVAVKVLASVGETRYQSQEDFKHEIAILRACRDPNIVLFLGASMQPDFTMLVTEYCDGGNLTRNLMAGRVSWYKRGKKIALEVARGLVYLHSRRIIHFDLKSPNILLARDGTAKISDVGMAKIMAREYSGVTGNVGTLAWAAPEMLLGARCTERADVYSYGVVLWEICTGQTPIRGQLRDVRVPDECPAQVRELMLDCLATNPRKRPSAMEIVDRLRALPDPPTTPVAAARRMLPPPPRPPGQQQQGQQELQGRWAPTGRTGRPGLAGPGSAAGRLSGPVSWSELAQTQHASAAQPPGGWGGAAAAARPTSVHFSSESDGGADSLRPSLDLEGAAHAAASSGYASPVPAGVAARAAAVRLAAAMGRDPTSANAGLQRCGSMVLGSLPFTLVQRQQAERQRWQYELHRANSSPAAPGAALRQPRRATSSHTSTVESDQLPSPPAGSGLGLGRPPLPLRRQRSLDDPVMQLGELQKAILQSSGSQPLSEGGGSQGTAAQVAQQAHHAEQHAQQHAAQHAQHAAALHAAAHLALTRQPSGLSSSRRSSAELARRSFEQQQPGRAPRPPPPPLPEHGPAPLTPPQPGLAPPPLSHPTAAAAKPPSRSGSAQFSSAFQAAAQHLARSASGCSTPSSSQLASHHAEQQRQLSLDQQRAQHDLHEAQQAQQAALDTEQRQQQGSLDNRQADEQRQLDARQAEEHAEEQAGVSQGSQSSGEQQEAEKGALQPGTAAGGAAAGSTAASSGAVRRSASLGALKVPEAARVSGGEERTGGTPGGGGQAY